MSVVNTTQQLAARIHLRKQYIRVDVNDKKTLVLRTQIQKILSLINQEQLELSIGNQKKIITYIYILLLVWRYHSNLFLSISISILFPISFRFLNIQYQASKYPIIVYFIPHLLQNSCSSNDTSGPRY